MLLLLLAVLLQLDGTFSQHNPKKIVAIMFENRGLHHFITFLTNPLKAFDHMLGHLKKYNPNIDGLNGDEFNMGI